MTNDRVVLGAIGSDEALAALARTMRDAGREVVLIGGHQTAEQLVRTALAEDAVELVVDGDEEELARVDAVRRDLGAVDIALITAAHSLRSPHVPE